MEFLEGEAEARFSWDNAGKVARKERRAFVAARRESLWDLDRRMAASVASAHERLAILEKSVLHSPLQRLLDQLEESQRRQQEMFLKLTRPVAALDFNKLFPPAANYKALLGPSLDFQKLFPPTVEFAKAFGNT